MINTIKDSDHRVLYELPSPPTGKTGWPWTANNIDQDIRYWCIKRPDWPKVSIVMPSLNQGEFIEESIRSVLLQGYPNLEFFIFDAGSTDNSIEIITRYEQWLTFWVSEKDRGQSDAINKGLRKSTGKYFNWQNSDDILTPCSLFKAVDALLEHPEASHVHGFEDVIYANGKLHSSTEQCFGPPTRLAPSVAESIANLKTGIQPGCLMDRELVVRVGGIDESLHYVMDIDIFLKLSVIKQPLYCHEKLVYYRYHEGTKSHNSWPSERALERLKVGENLFSMPEAQKYICFKKEAKATGHRYAADCYLMSGDILRFIYHMALDILWQPMKGWDRRRALFYFLKERKKSYEQMLEMK